MRRYACKNGNIFRAGWGVSKTDPSPEAQKPNVTIFLLICFVKNFFFKFFKNDFCDTSELVGSAQNLAFPGTPRAEFLRLRVF